MQRRSLRLTAMLAVSLGSLHTGVQALPGVPPVRYTVTMTDPARHIFHVELRARGDLDTIYLKMPRWMPGYYQIMDYARSVTHLVARGEKGARIACDSIDDHTWRLSGVRNRNYTVWYDVRTKRQFVASPYIDSAHAYILPEGVFLYEDGAISRPVSVKLVFSRDWTKVATGLDAIPGKDNEFQAPDFDVLYDCPILVGRLEELPSFRIHGIEHRFIGYDMGSFDRVAFMKNLEKAVRAASAIIGDIPYRRYTFIAIGKGRGGIEHLDNTTVSFDGAQLQTPEGVNKMMSFLSHEYFHNFNVKRIRPLELGPFDYERENRTNLLWVSEGLSVYYEYLAIRRGGIIPDSTLLENFEGNIDAYENDPGRPYQSLQQASYETWSDGPFGRQGEKDDRSISYYDKGPVVGLLLDFAIRHDTHNARSLDDVMRWLYREYYQQLHRGFTDAEFEQACEQIAGTSLSTVFEYVYTTRELDYGTYLGYGGLRADITVDPATGAKKYVLRRIEHPSAEQHRILESWLGDSAP